jgi:hypothetical protein
MRHISRVLPLMLFCSMVLLVTAQTHALRAPKSLADWKAMTTAIEDTIKKQFPDLWETKRYPVGVVRVGDLTGDGALVALVDLGTGGAYTDELCVVRFSEGKPVVALFKDRAGKLSDLTFAEGASVMNRASVELLPEAHSVYAMEWGYDGDTQKLGRCTGMAYTWNGRSQVFEVNVSLTKKLTKKKCAELPQNSKE